MKCIWYLNHLIIRALTDCSVWLVSLTSSHDQCGANALSPSKLDGIEALGRNVSGTVAPLLTRADKQSIWVGEAVRVCVVFISFLKPIY